MTSFGQIKVSGVVKSKDDKSPIPGVNVQIKGTKIGTVAKFDGSFEILVENPDTSVLIFSSVGFITSEIPVRDYKYYEVILKNDCNIDFFYHRYLGFGYYGGLINAPVGGMIEIFYPFLIKPALQLQIGY